MRRRKRQEKSGAVVHDGTVRYTLVQGVGDSPAPFFLSPAERHAAPGVASSGLRDPPPAVNSQIDNGKRNFQKVIKKLKKGVDKSKFLVYNVLVRLIKQLTQGGRNNDR